MKKIFIFFFLIFLFLTKVKTQNKISGKVSENTGKPLSGVNIYIPELNKGSVTDKNGIYELKNLPDGKIKVQYSFLGYSHKIKTVVLKNSDIVLDIVMEPTAIEAEEIVISGGYNSTQHENAVKIDILKLNSYEIKLSPNFTKTLTQIPGVDMITKGNGVAKPVIRGLSMNDILILNNGVRFENYQYSSHHPLGIDEFGIEDAEVIKGPASLMYGSDAIGGVINFIKEKPSPVNSMLGDYNLQLFSNSLGVTNNFGIKGASKNVFGGIRFGQKSHADYLQGGGDFVPNSRFNDVSFKANAGFTGKLGSFKLYYDFNNEKIGLTEEEAVESIKSRGRTNEIWYQKFITHLISSQNKLYYGNLKTDINIAFQNTELVHIGEINDYEIQMRLSTLSDEVIIHIPSKGDAEYMIGFQNYIQKNTNINNRNTLLLPDANIFNYSVFTLLQHNIFKKFKLQTGLRFDNKTIDTQKIGEEKDTMQYRPSINKSYESLSGSLGATYNVSNELLFRFNFASAYRTPNLAELTSKGEHELRFEIGNQNLTPENAYETDVSLHFHKNNIAFDLAVYYNLVNNYIYITPSGDTSLKGYRIYNYMQNNAILYGGEAGLHFHPFNAEWLHFEITYSMVTGKKINGEYLPFVPANKFNSVIRVEKEKLKFINKPHFEINFHSAEKQDKVTLDEIPSKAYQLFDITFGGNLYAGKQLLTLTFSILNLFDTKYIEHLSTLKEVGMYEPGRNFALCLKIPFSVKKTNS